MRATCHADRNPILCGQLPLCCGDVIITSRTIAGDPDDLSGDQVCC